jgi:hypothetical protein
MPMKTALAPACQLPLRRNRTGPRGRRGGYGSAVRWWAQHSRAGRPAPDHAKSAVSEQPALQRAMPSRPRRRHCGKRHPRSNTRVRSVEFTGNDSLSAEPAPKPLRDAHRISAVHQSEGIPQHAGDGSSVPDRCTAERAARPGRAPQGVAAPCRGSCSRFS